MICRESNSYDQSYSTSPTALLGPPDANELCSSPGLYSGKNLGQVQCNTLTKLGQQRRSAVVDGFHNNFSGSTSVPINNSAFRCIMKSGLGSSTEWSIPDRVDVVARGNKSTQKLSGTTCYLSSNQGFWEVLAE